MITQVRNALTAFTERWCRQWQENRGDLPSHEALYDPDSPCVVRKEGARIYWQPRPFTLPARLSGVEQAFTLRLQPDVVDFYTTQFSADMTAMLGTRVIYLIQVWNEQDFTRLQSNLIGHLVMKQRLKQTPTLFIASTEKETEVISVDNLTKEVIVEQPGIRDRHVLAQNTEAFLGSLRPLI